MLPVFCIGSAVASAHIVVPVAVRYRYADFLGPLLVIRASRTVASPLIVTVSDPGNVLRAFAMSTFSIVTVEAREHGVGAVTV